MANSSTYTFLVVTSVCISVISVVSLEYNYTGYSSKARPGVLFSSSSSENRT